MSMQTADERMWNQIAHCLRDFTIMVFLWNRKQMPCGYFWQLISSRICLVLADVRCAKRDGMTTTTSTKRQDLLIYINIICWISEMKTKCDSRTQFNVWKMMPPLHAVYSFIKRVSRWVRNLRHISFSDKLLCAHSLTHTHAHKHKPKPMDDSWFEKIQKINDQLAGAFTLWFFGALYLFSIVLSAPPFGLLCFVQSKRSRRPFRRNHQS